MVASELRTRIDEGSHLAGDVVLVRMRCLAAAAAAVAALSGWSANATVFCVTRLKARQAIVTATDKFWPRMRSDLGRGRVSVRQKTSMEFQKISLRVSVPT